MYPFGIVGGKNTKLDNEVGKRNESINKIQFHSIALNLDRKHKKTNGDFKFLFQAYSRSDFLIGLLRDPPKLRFENPTNEKKPFTIGLLRDPPKLRFENQNLSKSKKQAL